MKFLIIGHCCIDVVHQEDGHELEQPGGLFRTAYMLSKLVGKNSTVVPVCGIAREDFPRMSALFADLPGICTDALYKIDAPTNRVHVFHSSNGASIVCSKDIAPPIPFERLRRHLRSDAVLVNMFSGFDLTLETLDVIRMEARDEKIPIHFDFHNLTLGVNGQGERFRRPVEEWRRWSFMMETVQLNEEEMKGLSSEPMSEEQLAGHMFTLGVKGILVTRGQQGLTVMSDDHKRTVRKEINGTRILAKAPLAGCGDMFGAAFMYHYAKSQDIAASANEAVKSLGSCFNDSGTSSLSVSRMDGGAKSPETGK
jgi:sugar/nucleoside kinase (ribokinase family)